MWKLKTEGARANISTRLQRIGRQSSFCHVLFFHTQYSQAHAISVLCLFVDLIVLTCCYGLIH